MFSGKISLKRKKELNLLPKIFFFSFGFCADEEMSASLGRLRLALPSVTGLHMAPFVNCLQRKDFPGKYFAPPAVTTNTVESFIKQFMNEYRGISSIPTFVADEQQEMKSRYIYCNFAKVTLGGIFPLLEKNQYFSLFIYIK